MRSFYIYIVVLVLWGGTGCTDLVQVNPNEQTTDTYWQTEQDAMAGLNAAYNSLMQNGTYGRWLSFAYDLRSDIGLSRSPWTDLSNFSKFTFTSYDFEVNREIWQHHYQGIFRANQVINNVADIDMDQSVQDRLIGEARFIRALLYFNLVNLYANVPVVLDPADPTNRPAAATPEEVWAQIETDLQAAITALPESYGEADRGRATRGAATALLARAHLQQRDWNAAIQSFEAVINSPAGYDLLPDYAANFDGENENDQESIFEVQFTDDARLSTGTRGNNIPRMIGPCGVGFCDGNPTQWFFDQFLIERTTNNQTDPRLNATIFWNDPAGMDVFGTPFAERYGDRLNDLFWKKYSEHWKTEQLWDSPVNFKVMRLGGVLLEYAEALNEAGRTSDAYAPVNRVRTRVNLAPLSAGMSQDQMRDEIEHQIILELGLEHERFLYLKRHDLLGPELAGHDPEFDFFVENRAELLPIPQTEVDINTNVAQNPGW